MLMCSMPAFGFLWESRAWINIQSFIVISSFVNDSYVFKIYFVIMCSSCHDCLLLTYVLLSSFLEICQIAQHRRSYSLGRQFCKLLLLFVFMKFVLRQCYSQKRRSTLAKFSHIFTWVIGDDLENLNHVRLITN